MHCAGEEVAKSLSIWGRAAGLTTSTTGNPLETPQNTVLDHKPDKQSPTEDPASPLFIPRARYTAHEVEIDANGIHDEWPEKHERERKWIGIEEALNKISWRKDIATLLANSSLARTQS